MDIQGVAAIVTGGASGLGGGTVDHLVARGARVAIFDLNEHLGRAKAEAVGGFFVPVDVADEDAVTHAIAEAESRNGKARILVNCAGIGAPAKVLNREGEPLPLSAFRKIIDTNLIGSFNVLSKFAARILDAEPLADGERGVIVNTASVAAFDGQIGQPAYAASKGGIVAMALPIARELARFGIRVNTIAPGIFLTPLLATLPQEAQDSLGQQVPFPSRLGQPAEFAKLVDAIIDNPMLNGEVIRLDGRNPDGAQVTHGSRPLQVSQFNGGQSNPTYSLIGADPERLNVNGGAIALGHPLGATGTKLMTTLIHALRARGKRYGLQTMCEGGGIANVTILEAA